MPSTDQQQQVNLRARWSVVPGSGGAALAVEPATIQRAAGDSDNEALVAAHSEALADLSRSIAVRIGALQEHAPNP